MTIRQSTWYFLIKLQTMPVTVVISAFAKDISNITVALQKLERAFPGSYPTVSFPLHQDDISFDPNSVTWTSHTLKWEGTKTHYFRSGNRWLNVLKSLDLFGTLRASIERFPMDEGKFGCKLLISLR